MQVLSLQGGGVKVKVVTVKVKVVKVKLVKVKVVKFSTNRLVCRMSVDCCAVTAKAGRVPRGYHTIVGKHTSQSSTSYSYLLVHNVLL